MLIKWLALVLLLGFLIACASAPSPSKPDDPPTSFQASFVEAYSVDSVIIRASAQGLDNQDAINHARKTAIWFVLFAEQPGLLTPEQQQKFIEHQSYFYRNAPRYILHEGPIIDRRIEQGKTQISREFRVNLSPLRQDLIQKGILPSISPVKFNDPSIAIISDHPQANAVFVEYLQARGWPIRVLDQQARIQDLITQAGFISGQLDPHYLLALQAGNDIYIELSVNVSERQRVQQRLAQASISAKAYFTATGEQIASASGFSPERNVAGNQAIIAEAAHQAAHRLSLQLSQAWSARQDQGKTFKLVFSFDPELGDLSNWVHPLLQSQCESVRRGPAGQSSVDYLVSCGQTDSLTLLEKLSRHYTGPGQLIRQLDSGQLLMIHIGYPESNSIVIE